MIYPKIIHPILRKLGPERASEVGKRFLKRRLLMRLFSFHYDYQKPGVIKTILRHFFRRSGQSKKRCG